MIDLVGAGLNAVSARSATSYPLLFLAGLITSAGPCAAPRYVTAAALAQTMRRPWLGMGSFVAGLIAAYVALGFAAGTIASLVAASTWIYAALALALAAGGIFMLVRADGRPHPHAACAHGADAGYGGIFLLGAAGAFVVSPCCTPVLAAIAGLTLDGGRALDGALLLAAFAGGHAVPIVSAGALGRRASALLPRLAAAQAPAIVAGTLMLALAAYYGTLA